MAGRECQYMKCHRRVAEDIKSGDTFGLCRKHARQADRVLNSPRLTRAEYARQRKEN